MALAHVRFDSEEQLAALPLAERWMVSRLHCAVDHIRTSQARRSTLSRSALRLRRYFGCKAAPDSAPGCAPMRCAALRCASLRCA